jgi:hypothetical protein
MKARTRLAGLAVTLAAGTAHAGLSYTAPGGQHLMLTGYLREHIAVNLQDHPEAQADGVRRLDGRGEISMLRSTLRLEGKADVKWAQFGAVYRLDREHETGYLDDINDTLATTNAIHGPATPRNNWMDDIEGDQMREWYASFDVGRRVRATLGKQQVVWGETDFFRAMDIIHGYDLRWRSFLETENEELRKSLILANVEIAFPELNGSLQLVFRPGWDKAKELGNSIDIRGGRWAGQPTKGIDFIPLLPYNDDHGRADTDEPNYGFRWSSEAWGWGYTLNYWRGLNVDPVANSFFVPWGSVPVANGSPFQLGELIFPKVETYGATASGYVEAIDSVIRLEAAFTPDKPYNVGTDFGLPLGGGATLWVPGMGGIVEKNTLVSMIGIDKQLKGLSELLGTNQFPLLSLQLFDTWITNYKESDDIVETLGYGAPRREHTTYLTALFALEYKNSTIKPSLAGVVDTGNGDFVMIPALDLVFGNHWRIHTDMDLFFAHHQKNVKRFGGVLANEDTFAASAEDNTHLLGTFANNSQFNLRVTYQF